jgi:hypothetical protein
VLLNFPWATAVPIDFIWSQSYHRCIYNHNADVARKSLERVY